ncbi:endolytic transglycosylase MltG [Psychroflexus salis]|uniref:Endolytic murein transglycosylase n=1 Tax=Psychroflexus salis TaxID=1526574 RepID=A0A916ZZQ9_9FLAO|nr:endolytic transglycosylase MltG [Psychroflexus salis]GGE20108.1 aminodeoxychorismate lyase [Psychroflexus salis]
MHFKKIILLIAVIGLLAIGGFSYYIYQTIFSPNTSFSEDQKEVFIKSDATYRDVYYQLKPLLKNPDGFHKVANKKKYSTNVKAGRYMLKKGMNNNDIVNILRSANLPIQVSFNNQDFAELLAGRIAEQIEADSLSILKAIKDKAFLQKNNLSEATQLNIYLPNTYEMYWNTSAEEFRARMWKEYQKFWNKKRTDKAAQLKLTPNNVITLASIVQKETAKVDERPKVAGVYLNRLKRGMKLQADPTVIYALKKTQQNFDTIIKRVLFKDLQIDSPYNTYAYAGLPPGPIAMPDISSIEAVLNAEQHDYYYFVADLERVGYHKFAKTLAQHNRNAATYRQWMNKQRVYR